MEVETGVVPDGVSEAVTINKKKENDIKGGEQRRLDDQEDKGDGVRAKESLIGDKLGGDDGRKRRREEEIDFRREINSGGEDDGRGMEELGQG